MSSSVVRDCKNDSFSNIQGILTILTGGLRDEEAFSREFLTDGESVTRGADWELVRCRSACHLRLSFLRRPPGTGSHQHSKTFGK